MKKNQIVGAPSRQWGAWGLVGTAVLSLAACGGGGPGDVAGPLASPSAAASAALNVAVAAVPDGRKSGLATTAAGPLTDAQALAYIASYGDLIAAFGADAAAGRAHHAARSAIEGRTIGFDALRYVASHPDLMAAIGTDEAAAARHFITTGRGQGRTVTFDALAYTASYADLIGAFGTDTTAAARHYIQDGAREGRVPAFDGLAYIASYPDLVAAFGNNAEAGARHYIVDGFREGRRPSFDALRYIASYGDLIAAFGTRTRDALVHYLTDGVAEGRRLLFNAAQYLANYADVRAAFGADPVAATRHFIVDGYREGRSWAAPLPPPPPSPQVLALDAFRLADQASFGATEALVADIQAQGAAAWVAQQMALSTSRYTLGNGDAIHTNTSTTALCDQAAYAGPNCWRDWYSSQPLAWDFYRNATLQPDQLRQRVAFALQQILVVNNQEVEGTYGLRRYHNTLLDNAFGNYREVLRKVTLSPVMGDFLNNVNNDKAAPNENYGRELLQLFSLGTCLLNPDGSLQGGKCNPTYNNDDVRAYAYALTGWTYPAGGATASGCRPTGTNCRYLGGDMVPAERYHDTAARTLLADVTVPAASTAAVALERVLDSLMLHPNMAPFIGKQLIQHLVSSNPSPAYVQRVASAFVSGIHRSGSRSFGTGQRGDLAATVAAVLLDDEARTTAPATTAGKLREPVLMFTAVLRALNGRSDGEALTWWWGESLRQHVFRPPSVFNFYPPDYPVPGSTLTGPSFGLHNANTALERLNYLTYLLYWGGSTPAGTVPGAFGTTVNTAPFEADAADAPKLVDRLSALATGGPLPAAARSTIVTAVESFTASNNVAWRSERVKQAAYLVLATPHFQVQR